MKGLGQELFVSLQDTRLISKLVELFNVIVLLVFPAEISVKEGRLKMVCLPVLVQEFKCMTPQLFRHEGQI